MRESDATVSTRSLSERRADSFLRMIAIVGAFSLGRDVPPWTLLLLRSHAEPAHWLNSSLRDCALVLCTLLLTLKHNTCTTLHLLTQHASRSLTASRSKSQPPLLLSNHLRPRVARWPLLAFRHLVERHPHTSSVRQVRCDRGRRQARRPPSTRAARTRKTGARAHAAFVCLSRRWRSRSPSQSAAARPPPSRPAAALHARCQMARRTPSEGNLRTSEAATESVLLEARDEIHAAVTAFCRASDPLRASCGRRTCPNVVFGVHILLRVGEHAREPHLGGVGSHGIGKPARLPANGGKERPREAEKVGERAGAHQNRTPAWRCARYCRRRRILDFVRLRY